MTEGKFQDLMKLADIVPIHILYNVNSLRASDLESNWQVSDCEGDSELKPAMASTSSSSNSIAAELLSNITKYGYKNMVPYISEHNVVGPDTFKSSKLGQLFAVDTSRTYRNGRANPSHLFEIFGHFSGHEAMEVREVLLEHIARNLDFHVKRSI